MAIYSTRERALIISSKLDALARDYDYFDYMSVDDPGCSIVDTAQDIAERPAATVPGIMDWLQGIIEDESADDLAGTARDIMQGLFALYLDMVPAEAC